MGKSVWKSKTFWVNIIALAGMVYQMVTGNEVGIPVEAQASALTIINLVLRAVTKEPIVW